MASRGRPQAFDAKFIRAFKSIVTEYGLIRGREVMLAEGVVVDGDLYEVSISLPTLSKYVNSNQGGRPLKLQRGRPLGSVKVA